MAIKLKDLKSAIRPSVSKYLHNCGENVLADAKNKAPVDTGALRDSLHIKEETPTKIVIADDVDYGIYQELGTRNMEAQPFLRPALLNKNNYRKV